MLTFSLGMLSLDACARPVPPETWQVSIIVHDWLNVQRGADLAYHVDPAQPLGSDARLPGFRFSISDVNDGKRLVHLRCVPPGVIADIDGPNAGRGGDFRVLDVRETIDRDQIIRASTGRVELLIKRNP